MQSETCTTEAAAFFISHDITSPAGGGSFYPSHKGVFGKGGHMMFDGSFGKCGPIFNILSPVDLWENSVYILQIST